MAKVFAPLLWLPVIMTLEAWVFWHLWIWFVVPLGAPSVLYWHAFGLSMIVHWAGVVIFALPKCGLDVGWNFRVAKVLSLLLLWAAGGMTHALMQ